VIGGDGASLTELNGLVETARYAGVTAGPLLGGVLAGLGGTRAAMLVNAASFLVVALAVLGLRGRRHAPARSSATATACATASSTSSASARLRWFSASSSSRSSS
jgi:hypothetical protein